jgi:hypothetical protein
MRIRTKVGSLVYSWEVPFNQGQLLASEALPSINQYLMFVRVPRTEIYGVPENLK